MMEIPDPLTFTEIQLQKKNEVHRQLKQYWAEQVAKALQAGDPSGDLAVSMRARYYDEQLRTQAPAEYNLLWYSGSLTPLGKEIRADLAEMGYTLECWNADTVRISVRRPRPWWAPWRRK